MRIPMAATGTAAFFVLAPGVVAGLVPWWLTGWRVRQPLPWWAWAPLRVAGVALLVAGVIVLSQSPAVRDEYERPAEPEAGEPDRPAAPRPAGAPDSVG